MVRNLAIVLVLAGGGFVAYVTVQPDQMYIERTAMISAPPDVVFDLLDDFTSWQRWSPWRNIDPDMKTKLSGPPQGPGAVYEWSGNDEVGKGRMEIVVADPGQGVTYDITFIEPFEGQNRTEITIEPHDEGTGVSWVMRGENSFMAKVAGVFMDMDATIGADFERGLAKLDAVASLEVVARAEAAAEARAAAAAAAEEEAAKVAAEALEGEGAAE